MKRQQLSRRDFVRVSAAVAAMGALSACTPKAEPTATTAPAQEKGAAVATAPVSKPADAQGVTIALWTHWEQYKNAADIFLPTLEEIIAPNKMEITTGIGREEVFLPNVAAGTPPDMGAIASAPYNRLFMRRELVVSVDDKMAQSDVVSPDKFSEGSFLTCEYQGHNYGFPAFEGFVPWGLNYNAKLVTEAGLNPDTPPTTWSECLAWHKELTKFDAAGNLLQIGLDPQDAVGYGIDLAAASFGFDYWNKDTGEFTLDNELLAEAMEVYGEFAKVIGPDNLAGFRQIEGHSLWGGSYNLEVQAMILEGYWHPGETFTEVPDVAQHNRATWIPMSDARKGTKISCTSSHMVQFFKDAKNSIDVTWPVGEFLVSDIHLNAVFDKVGWLCPYTSFITKAERNKFPGLEFYFRSVEEADVMWELVGNLNPIATFLSNQFKAMRELVYRDQMTGAEAAAELQELAEQEWEEQAVTSW